MKIWQDIEIQWKGETYTVRPTMEFINSIEDLRGMSLLALWNRLRENDLPIGRACMLIAKTLNFAGIKNITDEDVYKSTGGISEQVIKMTVDILTATVIIPEDEEKQPSAASKKKPVK